MKKIGITGANGFVGKHLVNTLRLCPDKYLIIPFCREYFESDFLLDEFVKECDVIVHLAGLNRHNDPEIIYTTNKLLVDKLLFSLKRTNSKPHVILSSTSQEERDNLYGKSKKESRERFAEWASKENAIFSGMVIPNVFGPFGNPNYNSVIATFSYQLAIGEIPNIEIDGELKLIYVGELVAKILEVIDLGINECRLEVINTHKAKVSDILKILEYYKSSYIVRSEIPSLKNAFELQLFNTFRSYLDIANFYPRKFIQHADQRGAFVEIARCGIQGQTSFSTTFSGVTRGNHFHTRKIERFAVIKGKAQIQLRKIGTDEVINFFLDGENPAYVDMPIWYTHNIKNIGTEDLYTIFWINEPYNEEDPDTYIEVV